MPQSFPRMPRRPRRRPVCGSSHCGARLGCQSPEIVGATPRRVFLALGRKDLVPFEAAPQHHYLIRSVDPVWPTLALPKADYVTARGPFREIDERTLLSTHAIDTVVAKNSGGAASYGKIGAARALGLSVTILRRPPLPPDRS